MKYLLFVFKAAYPPENRFVFVAFSGSETIRKYILKILLRNCKNWLSYSYARRASPAEKKNF